MKKRVRSSLCVFFVIWALIGLQSCANDIEIFTDYQENAVIYGLLDLQSNTQYIKVGKAFLNPNTSAKDVAQISDSLYYEDIIVKLIEEQTGREILLNKIDSIPKDTGYFQNQSNILYATNENLVPANSYRLFVQNPASGYTASARTNIVGTPNVNFPVSNGNKFWSTTPELSIQLRFVNGANAKSQDAFFEFWVEEFPDFDTTQKVVKKLSWRFVTNLRNDQTTPKNRASVTPGVGLYEFFLGNVLNGVLNPDSAYQRRIIRTDFVLYSASQDLIDYVDASVPSIGIVQKQVEFSNIENGIGLFTSRNTFRISNITLDPATILFFSDNRYPKYNRVRLVE